MNNLLKIVAPIVLFVLLYSFVPTNAKSINRKNGNIKLGNPIFCQQRFNECIARGQKMRKPYATSPKTCAQQVYRNYYCTEASINKKFTAEEIRKYRIQSRAMESGWDYTLEEQESVERELTAPEAPEVQPVDEYLDEKESKSSEKSAINQDLPMAVPMNKLTEDKRRTLSRHFSNLLGR